MLALEPDLAYGQRLVGPVPLTALRGKPEIIPGRFVVELKTAVRRDEFIREHGLSPSFRYSVINGFSAPMSRRTADLLAASDSACSLFFRRNVVRKILDEHVAGTHDHKRALFSLLTFELWYQQFIRPARWE